MTTQEQNDHLRVLFSWMPPELLMQSIRENQMSRGRKKTTQFDVSAFGLSAETYLHCAQPYAKHLSPEELQNRFFSLCQETERERLLLDLPNTTIFTTPGIAAEQYLHTEDGEPLCRQETVLQWRRISFELGQDLFACALLAMQDARRFPRNRSFVWPPLLRTDDRALRNVLREGIAENHFHLNGSSQSFPITWGFLMNHPRKIAQYFQNTQFEHNLHAHSHRGDIDNQLTWEDRLCYAAWCRAFLFRRCMEERCKEEGKRSWEWDFLSFDRSMDKKQRLYRMIERLRKQYGARFQQPNGVRKCLDYAIFSALEKQSTGVFRFLAGERYLLYKCFYKVFSGSFAREDQDILYLYLLLKLRFRDELIQTNEQTGFRNFSDFQDRKDLFWSDANEYLGEARRMAVNAAQQEHIVSLEMRTTPGNSAVALRKKISEDDWFVTFANRDAGSRDNRLLGAYQENPNAFYRCTRRGAERAARAYHAFYAVHFIKSPDDPSGVIPNLPYISPRNSAVRSTAERQAHFLHRALSRDSYIRDRIRAVDAASFEIGCRPETFATEFRYLRDETSNTLQNGLIQKTSTRLHVTYHVGEDFLDLADGLRAIDEAICFLGLQRGDRIGHALALGVAPESHYHYKQYQCLLPKQDMLDNIIWILWRCKQWGVVIPAEYDLELQRIADRLMSDIYGIPYQGSNANHYFCSWQLRGDHPDLYRHAYGEDASAVVAKAIKFSELYAAKENYIYYKVNRYNRNGLDLDRAREKKEVLHLLNQYHFGAKERAEGAKIESFEIKPQYIQLMRDIQDQMIRQIAEMGIYIECNPTSNVLIGTFRKYARHPIFRFNNFGLHLPAEEQTSVQLRVSVNTDDQGVFDTSLEFEYALLMSSLQQRVDANGNRLMNDDEILDYLNRIRIRGIEMTFPR